MSIELNTETVPYSEMHRDPTILVQTFVIEQLHLDDDVDAAAMKYVAEGYSAKCRQIMESDSDVQSLIKQGRIEEAATLLTSLLVDWKRTLLLKLAA